MRFCAQFLTLVVLLTGAPGVAAGPEGLLWPVDSPPAVSSNFCEYREGHLHAGIDIRTFGAEGMPCRASGEGYVSRLRASSDGYGKTLYIQLDSGETLVYAHLAEFRPDLERALLERQLRAGDFEVDARFPRGRYPVRRGEVVAWSGSTGGVPPHLHFEIRDRGENPLNPFAYGFEPRDARPPVFGRVRFVPQTARSRINGDCWPLEPRVLGAGGGRYVVPDTLRLAGETGVSVEVYDVLNGDSGRLAPYRITLAVDGSLLADVTLDRFSFSHAGDVGFLYDMSRVRAERSYFYQLFEIPGESMWNRRFVRGGRLARGAVRAATGRRFTAGVVFDGRITAADFAGNASTLDFRFYVDDTPRRTVAARADRPPTGGLYVRNDFVAVRGPIRDALSLAAAVEGPSVTAARLAEPAVVKAAARGVAAGPAFVYGVEAGRAKKVDLPGLDLEMVYARNTLHADAVHVVESCAAAGNTDGLEPRGRPVCFGPLSAVLRRDVELRFRVRGADDRCAVFRLNEKNNEWIHYPSEVGGDVVSTRAIRPGTYGVFADSLPPRITAPVVGTRRSYATGEVSPVITIGVDGTGSGVDHERTVVSLDGAEQIFYWDSRAKKLVVVVHDGNIMGRRGISIAAFDGVGNRSNLETTIEFPAKRRPRGKDR